MNNLNRKIYSLLLTVAVLLLPSGCVTTSPNDSYYSPYSSYPVYSTSASQDLVNAERRNLELERQIREEELRRLQLQNKQLKQQIQKHKEEEAEEDHTDQKKHKGKKLDGSQ